jgi:iron complex transport system substrate-binding protein
MSARRSRGLLPIALAAIILPGWCGCGPSSRSMPGPAKPLRIASLTLATDELLAELVPPGRVVTVTAFADDPEISNVAEHYPRSIPRARDASPERIIALKPDLVCVAPYNTADSLELMARSGLSIYRNESVTSIAEIEAGLEQLAARVGEPARGRAMVERIRERRRRLADRLRGVTRRPRVMFWSAGFTAGRGSTIDDVIREGGGVNVAAELGLAGSAEIAPERVVAANPDVVLLTRWKGDDRQGQIANHPILRQLPAVREGRTIEIEGRYLTSVSQFIVEGAERLARALHPAHFPKEDAP